jgi:hypothetical protein
MAVGTATPHLMDPTRCPDPPLDAFDRSQMRACAAADYCSATASHADRPYFVREVIGGAVGE